MTKIFIAGLSFSPFLVGRNNRHCLCETCEKNGRGGYAPQEEDDVFSDRGSDSDSDTPSEASVDESKDVKLNVNQRSTRRGVYLVIPDSESDSEDSETEVRNGLAGLSGQLTPLPSTPECKQEVVEPEIPPAPLDTNELMEGVVQQLSRLPQDASTSTAPSPRARSLLSSLLLRRGVRKLVRRLRHRRRCHTLRLPLYLRPRPEIGLYRGEEEAGCLIAWSCNKRAPLSPIPLRNGAVDGRENKSKRDRIPFPYRDLLQSRIHPQ